MMDIVELKQTLEKARPAGWDEIPEIGLYMDQVLSFMKKQTEGMEGETRLTAPMVNNYIKKGMMPRADKKKYHKPHLVHLTAICLLKNILSVGDTDRLLRAQLEKTDPEAFYKKYCRILDEEMSGVSRRIYADMDREELTELILRLAVAGYAQKAACEKLLRFAESIDPEQDEKTAGSSRRRRK